MAKVIKKVLRIKRGEYLLAMSTSGVVLTDDASRAMDFSRMSEDEVSFVVAHAQKLGFRKAKIKDIEINVRDFEEEFDKTVRGKGWEA